MTAFWFLINALAAWRILRLIQTDTIFDTPRLWLLDWLNYRWRWGFNLFTCWWCLSVWVAAGVYAADRYLTDWWRPAATILAVAAVAGWLAQIDDKNSNK